MNEVTPVLLLEAVVTSASRQQLLSTQKLSSCSMHWHTQAARLCQSLVQKHFPRMALLQRCLVTDALHAASAGFTIMLSSDMTCRSCCNTGGRWLPQP